MTKPLPRLGDLICECLPLAELRVEALQVVVRLLRGTSKDVVVTLIVDRAQLLARSRLLSRLLADPAHHHAHYREACLIKPWLRHLRFLGLLSF